MNKNTMIMIVAALVVGLMVGILGPRMFGGKPAQVVQNTGTPAPPAPAPGAKSMVQINAIKNRLKNNPNDVALLIQLGNSYFDANMPVESIEAYEKALALAPGNPNVMTDLGVMYRRNGQSDVALEKFQEAAAIDPNHPQSRMNIGVVLLYDFDDRTNARAAFEDFLRVVPSGPQADQIRALIAQIDQGGQ
jgi:cytochrome c-type biogenesis protein CcmH/NrfG